MTEVSTNDEELQRKPITPETKEWSPELDTVLPINGSDIPNFKEWISWNGFHLNRETKEGHDGFDFAAYLTTDNRIVLGLPETTKIRAVADGVVKQVLDTPEEVGGGAVIGFQVDNVKKTCEGLKKKNVKIFDGPKTTNWGQTVAYFKDLDGNIWEISNK